MRINVDNILSFATKIILSTTFSRGIPRKEITSHAFPLNGVTGSTGNLRETRKKEKIQFKASLFIDDSINIVIKFRLLPSTCCVKSLIELRENEAVVKCGL